MSKGVRWLIIVLVAGIGLFLLIQLIPVGHENPPVVTQAQWDSPQTEALFTRACADCHSNETVWPWYTSVAPVSWLIARDVNEGRERFNISNLQAMDSRRLNRLPEEIQETVSEGEMPMQIYVLIHSNASLTNAERQALIQGLQQTLQATLNQ